ncbi:glycyl radical protein [Diplocloster agilis]|uniref:Uncharacterized protein n=1 Tax=Diplocloster agilis TaxID=2850323 RepID=A0A949JXR9_9FIRM|nr:MULTISPECIES: pyruvate formate lyase family protein [Lachnospiraceae]MBU9735702.1 hypothetical protein [Diplocloster agilis]MCU6732440.1 hypothetical protein [Suonthocola fibrivorans]SCI47155.1 4-hydroxyphenylacetate decarboxylase large subunit [uncultured Clostridium sp.]
MIDMTVKKRPRVREIYDRLLDTIPTVDMDRARIVTDYYKTHESEPVVMKRGGSMAEVFKKLPAVVRPNELIVGAEGRLQGSVQVYPEYNTFILKDEINDLSERLKYSKYTMDETDKKEFLEVIEPYWKGRTMNEHIFSLIPIESQKAANELMFTYSSGTMFNAAHTQPNYYEVMRRGTKGLVQDIDKKIDLLNLADAEDQKKYFWYKAAKAELEALPVWAGNYADEAERQAKEETDQKRKKELMEIARICRKVPAEPAETFHEALQAVWFCHVAVRLETCGISISMGRFDMELAPYLEKDIAAGRLTWDQAEELMECMWLKFNESNIMLPDAKEPFMSRQALTIGGVDDEGRDVTSDMSYLIIKTHESIHLHQPSICMRVHAKTPYELLKEALRVNRMGGGIPSFFNDKIHIPALMNRGASLKDARNYGIVGCVEPAPAYRSWASCSAGKFNLPKCFMLSLHDGADTKTGRQIGIKVGKAEDFHSFEEVKKAYADTVAHFAKLEITAENAIEIGQADCCPVPLMSSLHTGCIDSGTDVTAGGAKYNWAAPQTTGQASVGDGLEAIKIAVFDEKKISMGELLEIVDSNYAGHEEFRQYLLNLPKYGNDIDEPDYLVRFALKAFTDQMGRYRNARGGIFHAGSFPGPSHVTFGNALGATPDGRRAGEAFPAGLSPVSNRNTAAFTSIVNSASKLDYYGASNGTVITAWLSDNMLSTDRGIDNVAAVIKTYFERDGQEIQFNVVSAEELKEAQENPEKHRALVIRVTGWSSFFVGLDKSLQDELIERELLRK